MRYVIRGTACDRRRHRGWPARALFFVCFLIAPLPDWKPPTASTTCHDPAPPEYDGSPSNEGILECPEHACTSRRLPQPRRFLSLPAALPAGKARVPPRRRLRRPERRRTDRQSVV